MEYDDSNQELLRLWQDEEDKGALDELLRRELQELKGWLRSPSAPGSPRVGTQDDVAQNTVLKFLQVQPPPKFPTSSALRSYLWTAARHLLIDRLRRSKRVFLEVDRRSSSTLRDDPSTAGSVDRIEREDLGTALEVAVNLMRPSDQEILREVYFEQRTISETADRLRISPDVANTRLVRARLRLAKKIAGWKQFIE